MKEKWQPTAAAISLSSSGTRRHLSALFARRQHYGARHLQPAGN
jgi:hypothetical protein